MFKKIISFLKLRVNNSTETFIIEGKQCPHCTSRGLFIFNSDEKTKIKVKNINEKKS